MAAADLVYVLPIDIIGHVARTVCAADRRSGLSERANLGRHVPSGSPTGAM
jgi:hypothetical protein